jgi:hypothetical protein
VLAEIAYAVPKIQRELNRPVKTIVDTAHSGGQSVSPPNRISPDVFQICSAEERLTMRAYEKPVLAGDLVYNAATFRKAGEMVIWFEVGAVNQQSIHNHSAFAVFAGSKSEGRNQE